MTTPTVPGDGGKIDDKFWLSFSQTMVKESISNIDGSAAKLQTYIGWLWTVYTAGAAIGVSLAKLSFPWYLTFLIFLPSVLLIFAYFLAQWSQTSIQGLFTGNEAVEIKANYVAIASEKYRRFQYTLWTVIISSVLVIVALGIISFSHQPSTPTFKASLNVQDTRDTIAFTGNFPADTTITIIIAPTGSTDTSSVSQFHYLSTSAGIVQEDIVLSTKALKYDITVTWKDKDGLENTLKRTVP